MGRLGGPEAVFVLVLCSAGAALTLLALLLVLGQLTMITFVPLFACMVAVTGVLPLGVIVWAAHGARISAALRGGGILSGRAPGDAAAERASRAEQIERLCPRRAHEPQGGAAEEKLCVICLEPQRPGEACRVLQCGHELHGQCIDGWWLGVRAAELCCPLCKHVQRPTLISAQV